MSCPSSLDYSENTTLEGFPDYFGHPWTLEFCGQLQAWRFFRSHRMKRIEDHRA
jgi:hypothetical protein